MNATSRLKRIWVLYAALGAAVAVLSGKLFLVQVVNGDEYREKAERQYVVTAGDVFDRGSIFFTEKGGSLFRAATLRGGYTIALNPQKITDPEFVFQAIAPIVPIRREDFFARAEKKDDPYEVIASRVSEEAGRAIADMRMSGVVVSRASWRVYPGGELGAHTLGFVGSSGVQQEGVYGLERYYEDMLARQKDLLYVNFFAEIFSNIRDVVGGDGILREADIITSIEPSVQGFLEETLEVFQNRWAPDSIGGIIIHPKTGEIYAMGSRPTFDPNSFGSAANTSVFANPLVERVFEMGSIMKPITMAAGLDSGAVTATTEYVDTGSVVVDGARLKNFDGQGRGRVSMQTVLNKSLNTGVVFVMQKMGKDVFRDYMRAFGFGDETGIDLPNETAGLVKNLDSVRDVEYATAAFGQGIAVTPIAMARALSVLGNGGVLPFPHLATRVEYVWGGAKQVVPAEGVRVIRPETSEEITRMLVAVVDEALLDGRAKMPRYSIAAKTGTAQVAKSDGGGYYSDRFVHSFFGYFPAYDPKFLVFLYAVHPKGAQYAADTLTPPFIDIAKFLIHYYNIAPDR